jgi:hypothetical protein
LNADDAEAKRALLGKVWDKRGLVTPLSFWQRFMLVKNFMKHNAWKMKGAIAWNIVIPLVYMMVAGMLAIYLIGEPEEVYSGGTRPISDQPLYLL